MNVYKSVFTFITLLFTGSSDTPTSPPVSTPASVSTTTTTAGPQVPGSQGLAQAGLPQNFLQGVMQQILQQTGKFRLIHVIRLAVLEEKKRLLKLWLHLFCVRLSCENVVILSYF